MAGSHEFNVQSTWSGGIKGQGSAKGVSVEIPYGVPKSLGGDDHGASPEELLLSSVASCYSITLGLLTERKRVPVQNVRVDATGILEQQAGGTLKFASVLLKVQIVSDAPIEQHATLLDLAHKAELYCPISGAIRGSVTIELEPEIVSA